MKEYRWFYEFARWPLTAYTYLLTRLHVEGVEHIPAKGPVILVSNHLSMMDILVIAVPCKRLLHFMGKAELFRIPVFGFLIRMIGAFPVRRGESDREALRTASDVLAAGQLLVMFPEGHRSDDHALIRGHSGVTLIAMRAGDVPIIPIGISGTERVGFPRLWPFAPRVRIVYGEPFTLPSTGRRTHEELEHATDLIMRRIAALLPPAYRGVYAEPETVPAAAGTLHEDAAIGASDPLGLTRPADDDAAGEPTPPGA